MVEGVYLSKSGKLRAELRQPGTYNGIKMLRHYAIYQVGQDAIQGHATTLKQALATYDY